MAVPEYLRRISCCGQYCRMPEDAPPVFSPEQIAVLHQQRRELLHLIESNQETIARCEDMLRRLDDVLERIEYHQTNADQSEEQQKTGSGLLSRWLTRKAS